MTSRLWINAWPVAVALGLRLVPGPGGIACYIFVAAYALLGRKEAIAALLLSWACSMLNPGIAAEVPGASVGRYLVLASSASSVLLHSGVLRGLIQIHKAVLATFLLGAFFVVHSLFVSPFPDVSILKAISWTLTMVTLIAAWGSLSFHERNHLANQIYGFLVFVLLVSVPLVISPLGYLRNGTGFQGVLNHPQAFGPVMALLGSWAASRMLGRSPPPWRTVALVGLCITMILLSEARTAGLAFLIALCLAVFVAPGFSRAERRLVLPGLRSKRTALIATLGVVFVLLAAPQINSAFGHYLSKSGRSSAGSVLDAYEISRGRLIDKMWSNIVDHPIRGIGFGIASDPYDMEIQRDPLLGLPVSAAIEKGVLPLAVLEEVGLFGALFVGSWMLSIIRRGAQGGVEPVAVGLTALLLNMGESTLFSPGGLGLLSLILIGWAMACGRGSRI